MSASVHTILLDDVPVTISVTPEYAVSWLRDWLAFFPSAPPAGAATVEIHPSDGGRFTIATRAGSDAVSLHELEPLLDQSLRALLRHAGHHPLAHAALIGDGVSAVVLTGQSGTGKTALVKAAVRSGLCYWSDEYVLMASRGALGYPRCLELEADEALPLLRHWHYTMAAETPSFGHAVGLLPPRWLPWPAIRAVVHLSGDFDQPLRLNGTPYRAPLWHRPARTGIWPVLSRLVSRPHFVCRGGGVAERLDVLKSLLTGQM